MGKSPGKTILLIEHDPEQTRLICAMLNDKSLYLGYHLKTGHTLSVQNRPIGLAEDVIVLPC